MFRSFTLIALLCAAACLVQAAPVVYLTEGFDDVATLTAAGWTSVNRSDSPGSTEWFQGNSGIFTAYSGASDSYVAANFNATDGSVVDLWLITPVVPLYNTTVSFFTRTESESLWPDNLIVYYIPNAVPVDLDAPDPAWQLLELNPTYTVGGYPTDWTQFAATTGRNVNAGRFAFRYYVPDVPNNGDYIGIDDVLIQGEVPEPAALWLTGLGIAGLALLRRRKQS